MRPISTSVAASLIAVLMNLQTVVAQSDFLPGEETTPRVGIPKVLRAPARAAADAAATAPSNGGAGFGGQRDVASPESRRGGRSGRRGGHGARHGWGHYHHHHHGGHDRGPDDVFVFWLPGFPLWGNVGYTPAFGGFDNGYPYVLHRGFSVWNPDLAGQQAVVQPAPDLPAPDDPASADAKQLKIRPTNADAKARAGRFLGHGDAQFRKQSFLAAIDRYKMASRAAPDLAEPYIRQGFAYVAMAKYESAADAFRRGLGIRSDWTGSPFRLDELYGDNQLAKSARVESMAIAVDANPLDADLLMLVGLHLFFDGQADRSEVFFTRAAQLGGNDDRLLDAFLPRPGPAGAGKPQAGPKPDDPKPNDKVVF